MARKTRSPYGSEVVDEALDARGEFRVSLQAAGNPDRGQNPNEPLWGVPTTAKRVSSLREASEACSKFISEHGLGAGNWTGGDVTAARPDGVRTLVARVSYNGRVWRNPVLERAAAAPPDREQGLSL